MPKYILLLHEAPDVMPDFSPEQMQEIIDRYKRWRMSLAERGILSGGEKLRDGAGRVLRKNSSKLAVTDGPYAESKEVIGGYFLLEAPNLDKAVELSSDCPHLEFGAVEVREIEPV